MVYIKKGKDHRRFACGKEKNKTKQTNKKSTYNRVSLMSSVVSSLSLVFSVLREMINTLVDFPSCVKKENVSELWQFLNPSPFDSVIIM